MARSLSWLPDLAGRRGPLYQALADQMAEDIASGRLAIGTKLPPQRALAWALGVTHGTVTRAYERAEKKGLARGEVGRGTFVTRPQAKPSPLLPPADDAPKMDLARNFSLPHLDPDLGVAMAELAQQESINSLMNYVPAEGLLRHREAGEVFFGHFNIDCMADQLLVTSGAQHGMQVIMQAAFREGDAIAVDALNYPNLLSAAPRLGIRLVPVQSDGEGMSADHLEQLCHQKSIAGLVVMPNVHNPTGCQLSYKRLTELAEIAERHSLVIMEDDPYSALLSGTKHSFYHLLPQQTCAIATSSKVIGGGLRTGYLLAPAPLRPMLARVIGDTSWMASPILAEIARYWIMSGEVEKVLARKRQALRGRHVIVRRILGNLVQLYPDRLSCWVPLARSWDPAVFELEAHRRGISVLGGHHFVVGNGPVPQAVRLTLGAIQSNTVFEQALLQLHDMLKIQEFTP